MTVPTPTPALGSAFSTYRVGGRIEEAYFPETLEQAEALLHQLGPRLAEGVPFQVLGWGGNTLVSSQGLDGITLITRKLTQFTALDNGRFRIGAGVHLAKVATQSVDAGLTGGECLIGIPGTMGGAVVMNAGAMQQETSTIVERVCLYDLSTRSLHWISHAELGFAYRQSAIEPARQIVLAVDCLFTPGDVAQARARMKANRAFRKEHHPTEPNGGSVFRNPDPAHPAGKLIDQLGGPGHWREGRAMVSPKHGNFIINLGDATSTDILRLMARMQRAVFEATGWRIYPENRWMGRSTDEERALWQQLKQGDPHGDAHAA